MQSIAIRRFFNYYKILMLPLQHPIVQGAVAHELPPPPLPREYCLIRLQHLQDRFIPVTVYSKDLVWMTGKQPDHP